MLYFYQITGFGCVCAQKDGAVHRSQHAFIGIGCNICSKVFFIGIEMVGDHSTSRTIQNQSVDIWLRDNRSQIIFFIFFVLTAKLFFPSGTLHQGVFASDSQRVQCLHAVYRHFSAEDVLYVHDVKVLPVEQFLQGIHTEGVVHNLTADFTVHIAGKVVAQRGEGNDTGSNQKKHRQHGQQYRKTVQLGYTKPYDFFKCILIDDSEFILELEIVPESFTPFSCHYSVY